MRYAALLRAVNLGPHGKISMPDLRALVTGLGYRDVRTVANSGNVVFSGDEKRAAELESELEQALAGKLDLRTDVMVRDVDGLAELVAANPFPEAAERDPGHLLVMFLKAAPEPAAVEALRGAIAGREAVQAEGPHLYVTYPDGIGRSKLTNQVIESKLGTRGTGRNWNTVLKLRALA